MLINIYLFVYGLMMSFMVVISVAFVTLLERKILGFIQLRYGPNKNFFVGGFQPIMDAFKLLSKSNLTFLYSSGLIYLLLPLGMMMIMLFCWVFIPCIGFLNIYLMGGIVIICLLSVGIYPIIFGSWFNLSIYSMLGGVRCVAQMISYEVSLIMILMGYFLMVGGFNFVYFFDGISLFYLLPLSVLMFLSMLMELNRSPSDLIEGESELVSGFNTEYFGVNFSLIFLGEYGMIMFMGSLFMIMVMNLFFFSIFGLIGLLMFLFLVIWIRGSLPRIRYDELMYICWSSVVSISLGYLVLICGVFIYL